MRTYRLVLLVLLVVTMACDGAPSTPSALPTVPTAMPAPTRVPTVATPTASATPAATIPTHVPTAATPTASVTPAPTVPTASVAPSPSPMSAYPPVVGPEPSYRVAAFYYPWYRAPETDARWVHWERPEFHPPLDISSDYYPVLGSYSSVDPKVVAQHCAWLREAGVGVIITSWWGQGSNEDQAVPVLLDVGQRYGIRVAFCIEPYRGRTADRLVDDVRYIYSRYGDHPAFFRSTASSRWSPDGRPKGLFFVWSIGLPGHDGPAVEAGYWREAVDAIHALPDGGLVIASTTKGDWVDGGHFDGLYNYATLKLGDGGFSWGRGLPPEAWYVPSVLPGFSARRVGYPEDLYVPRRDGDTYDGQWKEALDAGLEPALVTITSFNEWHEGTQIEPAAVGVTNGLGYTYEDYRPLPPDGYLTLTRQWAGRFLETTWPEARRMRIRIVTTSDWTTFALVDGATGLWPHVVSLHRRATYTWLAENCVRMTQPISRARARRSIEIVIDVLVTGSEVGGTLVFEIGRGHLGWTQVELLSYAAPELVVVETLVWDGVLPVEPNVARFEVPTEVLWDSKP